MVLSRGIEPPTPSLPRTCSTPELRQRRAKGYQNNGPQKTPFYLHLLENGAAIYGLGAWLAPFGALPRPKLVAIREMPPFAGVALEAFVIQKIEKQAAVFVVNLLGEAGLAREKLGR